MKKALKVIAIVATTTVVALLLLPLIFYIPPVQQWAVQVAASVASESTGLQVSVGSVSLGFPLRLQVGDVLVVRPSELGPDTIASIGHMEVNVGLLPLLREEVKVDVVEIGDAKVNTLDLVSDTQISGSLGLLSLSPSRVHLGRGEVDLDELLLRDADISVILSDTAAVDTTDTVPLPWRIDLRRLTISKTAVSLSMPGDTMRVGVYLGQAKAEGGHIDLASETYSVTSLCWEDGQVGYDLTNVLPQEKGLDYNHIALTDLGLCIDSIYYHAPYTRLNIHSFSAREQSGLAIDELSGLLALDEQGIKVPSMTLRTPSSNVYLQADVDYSVADSVDAGQLHAFLNVEIGKEDLLIFLPPLYNNARTRDLLPNWPLTLKGRMDGNMQLATLDIEKVEWPTVFDLQANGMLGRLMTPDYLQADVSLRANAYRLDGLLAAFDLGGETWRLPAGLAVEGRVQAAGPRYGADITACDGTATLEASGYYDLATETYSVDVSAECLDLQRFLPATPCAIDRMQASFRGQGTDPLHREAWIDGNADIGRIVYDGSPVDSLLLAIHLKEGHVMADVTSQNRLVDGSLCLDAVVSDRKPQQLTTTVNAHLNKVDLYALHLTSRPLTVGFTGDFKASSNFSDNHKVSGLVSNIYLRDSVRRVTPQNLGVLVNARPDTTYLRLQSGNLIVKMDASGSYDRLFDRLSLLADTVDYQLQERIIDQKRLKQMLPNLRLYATIGTENPLANFLKASQDITFRDLLIDVNTSPLTGLNGQAHLYALTFGTTRIDTIGLTLKDTDRGLTYQAQVTNDTRNPQMVFNTLIDGHVYEHGVRLGLRFFDKEGHMGLRVGTAAAMDKDGLRFTLLPARPTLGYREFAVNADNFILLGRDQKLLANVDLAADDGTGVKVYSEDNDSTALQDITVSLHNIDLGQLTAPIPFLPAITGLLNGDYHFVMDHQRQMSVAGDMQVDRLTYEGNAMGNLATEFVYLQREDDTHAIDGFLMQDGHQVASLQGSYRNKKVTGGKEQIDGQLLMERLPLNIVNGFVPDQLLGLEGFAEGQLSINGSLSRPQVDGEVLLDSAFLFSQPYGVRLRFDDDPVRIQQSKLLLENFTMYAYNDNPLNIMGELDFGNTDKLTLDVRMRARDFMLINARQTTASLTYGKAFVNFFARMNGPLDQLNMRGRLDVLGSTDLTYLMLDSPLSTDNQMDELVKFTDFNDTTQTVVNRPTPNGLNLDLTVSVDPGAHVKCGLNVDQTNYVDLFGGGDLRMRYTGTDGLLFMGRYTLTSGEMKYSLPIIPLKTFTIQDGSYVEFTGDPMNPTLNITATERTRATVGQGGGQSRSVAFDCGVVITKTLADMGLRFIIDAPEDMSVSSELNAMSQEQQSKLAVTMLTTGMYLADGNTSGFSMNSALSSFLQSEINNITGNALKTLDLSIGLDNTTDASGQMHTDYSFKFAKRFWNNRLKVQIGGKVSSGQEVEGQNKSFFDNVTMEYRLSPTGNQYVKLFYNQNAYDWLEGYTGEYGGGFIWKRKLDTLSDIFRLWGKQDNARLRAPRDSTRMRMPMSTRPGAPRDSTRTRTATSTQPTASRDSIRQ